MRRIHTLSKNIYYKLLFMSIMFFLQNTAMVKYRFIVHRVDTVMLHPISRKRCGGPPTAPAAHQTEQRRCGFLIGCKNCICIERDGCCDSTGHRSLFLYRTNQELRITQMSNTWNTILNQILGMRCGSALKTRTPEI